MKPSRFFLFFSFLLILDMALAQDSDALWKRWNQARDAGDWKTAEAAARDGLKAFPKDSDFAICLATALRNQKRSTEAVSVLEPFVKLKPAKREVMETYAYALLDVGWAFYEKGEQAKAYEPFKKARDLLPDDQYVANAWGCVLRDTGKTEEAVRVLETALAKWPDSQWIPVNLASALRELKPASAAVDRLEALLEARPGEKAIEENLAYALLDMVWEALSASDAPRALDLASRARSLLPEDQFVANAWGCALRDAHRLDEAIEVLEAARDKWPDDRWIPANLQSALVQKANALATAGDGRSEAFFLRAGKLDPRSEEYLLNYGIYLNDAGRRHEALSLFEECGRIHPDNPWWKINVQYALQEIGRDRGKAGDWAGALKEAKAAMVRFPGELWFILDAFDWSLKLSDWEGADRVFREALSSFKAGKLLDYGKAVDPKREDLFQFRLSSLVSKYAEHKRYDSGFALIEAAKKAFPVAYWPDETRGNLLFHSGRKDEGVDAVNAVYEKWIKDHPEWQKPLVLPLPIGGTITVWGNSRRDSVTHAGMNRFCFDFMGCDGEGKQLAPGTAFPGRNEDYLGFGRDVLSVCDGIVESVDDGYPDIEPRVNPVLGDGNIVVVADGQGRHYNYVHLKKGTATVKPGERVKAGQKLGELGNSGYTSTPHLHFGVYSPDWKVSLPVRFTGYELRQADGSWQRVSEAVAQTGDVIRD